MVLAHEDLDNGLERYSVLHKGDEFKTSAFDIINSVCIMNKVTYPSLVLICYIVMNFRFCNKA